MPNNNSIISKIAKKTKTHKYAKIRYKNSSQHTVRIHAQLDRNILNIVICKDYTVLNGISKNQKQFEKNEVLFFSFFA